MIKIKEAGTLITKTYKNWIANDPFQLSAAVSYYALFSFPALLIIIIQTAGLFYDRSEIKNKILLEIGSVLGKDSADSIQTIIKNAVVEDQTTFAFIVGIATLLYGATGLFIALQKSLNTIWEVPHNKTVGFFKMIKNRLFSLSLVLIIGFLLLISMVVTTIISGISNWIEANFSDFLLRIIHLVNFLVSLGIITVLFGMIFKILPDVNLKWKHVWLGAFVTSLLFDIGKFGLGVYFGTLNPESTFGAAGSIVLILLWVSYSSLILFFGAEFTKVYSETMLKKEKLKTE